MPVSSNVTKLPAAPSRQDDLALVERCRQGDLGAFEEVYRSHSRRLYGVAVRMLGNPADAEDMLQEIFLAAHRKLDVVLAASSRVKYETETPAARFFQNRKPAPASKMNPPWTG